MNKPKIDLTGQQFGEWTVLSYAGNKYWNCICSCGKISRVNGNSLRKGQSKSCGRHINGDLTGQRFGKLIALNRIDETKRECVQYRCCDCGKEIIALATNLRNGRIKSCGCSRLEHLKKLGTERIKHGKKYTRLYNIWIDMKSRCHNANNNRFSYYGGRGITVCDEWCNNFQAFYDWAMANGYNPEAKRGECTIDRIDVNGNYEPSNCRWVDSYVQANNTTKNRVFTINGTSHTVAEWARICGINYHLLRNRLRHGWDIEEAITTPVIKNQNQTLISRR